MTITTEDFPAGGGADETPDADGPAVSLSRITYQAHVPTTALLSLAVVIVAAVLIIGAMGSAQQILGLAGLALVLSAVVTPAVERLGRLIGAPAAALLVHLVVLFALAIGTVVVLQNISSEAEALEAYTEAQLEELGDDGAPGVLNRVNLSQRLSESATSWGTIAVVGDDQVSGIAARLSQLVIVVVLSVFFTLSRRRLLDITMGWLDDRERRRVAREIWTDSVDSAACYLRRALLVGTLSGVAAGIAAHFLDLPGVVLIGCWAALLSIVPLLGPPTGWMPIVVLTLVNHGAGRALVALAISLGAVAVIGLVRHRIMKLRARPGSFIVAVGIAAGLAAAGLPGAAAGLFVAAGMATAATHDWSVFRPAGDRVASGVVQPVLASRLAGDTDSAPESLRLLMSRRTVLRIAALIVLASMIQMSVTRVGPTLVWAVVGLMIAVGLDLPVSWLEKRLHAPRPVIVIGGALLIAAALTALLVGTRWQLDAAPNAEEDVPAVVNALEDLPLVGDRLASFDLDRRFDQLERRLPFLINRSPMAGQAFGLLGGGLVGFFWVTVTSLTALLDGPRLVAAVDRRIPARFLRQARRLAGAGKTALAGYVGGSALVASINGLLVGSIAMLVGTPIPVVLALWAFTWNFIPQIGAIIGWTPLLVLSLAVNPLIGVGVLLFFIIYQAVENNLLQPTIVGQAVDISPLAALGAALFGAAVGGLIGAVLAIPIVGVGKAVLSEYRRDDFPRVRVAAEA